MKPLKPREVKALAQDHTAPAEETVLKPWLASSHPWPPLGPHTPWGLRPWLFQLGQLTLSACLQLLRTRICRRHVLLPPGFPPTKPLLPPRRGHTHDDVLRFTGCTHLGVRGEPRQVPPTYGRCAQAGRHVLLWSGPGAGLRGSCHPVIPSPAGVPSPGVSSFGFRKTGMEAGQRWQQHGLATAAGLRAPSQR